MVVGSDRYGDFQAAGRSSAETVSGGEPGYASGNAQNAGGRFAEVKRLAAGRKTEIVAAQNIGAIYLRRRETVLKAAQSSFVCARCEADGPTHQGAGFFAPRCGTPAALK